MAEDERTRRWERVSSPDVDPMRALRDAIAMIKIAPRDQEARRQLRALAAEQASWEPLSILLLDEARAAVEEPPLAAAFYEELADAHENLDQPIEAIMAMEAVIALQPDHVEHHDRLAWLYRKSGAAVKAAQAFERVAELARDDRARAALRAAGRLYRDSGRAEQAVAVYRKIVERRPSDKEAWRALEEILGELGQWRELADVRGKLAERASGVDKAVLLRAQARAMEQAGDTAVAAKLVASAAGHAPEDVSGLVDYAAVLAREGRATEAAQVLGQRISEAIADGAPSANIAALRLRLVDVLDGSGDRPAAQAVLDKLLATSPEYQPALEKLVQLAARDDDPRIHAVALLRQAAALAGTHEACALVLEAARRYRDAGDLRKAAHTFEQAVELSPDDDALHEELEDARTALVVDVAAAEAAAGDTRGAEQRLRKILSARPHHPGANLALVELLGSTDRLAGAAAHLRDTLADAPEDIAPEQLAKLVLRYAQVNIALGERDLAHQLLHEAHHLSRRDLLITLALGESCSSRKLWREAAIHLGSLADHPDAPRHAANVAAGLVKAGQAEVRALKPANAAKHYEAAVRIDPKCGPAWHALAELATEQGDMSRAADCLEAEASATVDPATRLRLYDALGDLSLDVLADPARAERCWWEVAGAGNAAVLEKLLALQRKRGAAIERGETCERLAALSDKQREKELTVEAAEAFAAGGDHARARAVADYLISRHPLDVDAIVVATKIAEADPDVVAGWLRRALGAWDAGGDRGDGDPRRADLWRRLGDAEKARVNVRASLDAYQRAVVTAPESDGALAARRNLIKLASLLGRNEKTSRLALVEAEQRPADILEAARDLARSGDVEDARAMYELARAVVAEPSADSPVTDERATKPSLDPFDDRPTHGKLAPEKGARRQAFDDLPTRAVPSIEPDDRPTLARLSTGDDTTAPRARQATPSGTTRPRTLEERPTDADLPRPPDGRPTESDLRRPAVLLAEDEAFLDRNPPRIMASDEAYAAPLDDAERRALVDDTDDGVLGELLSMIGEVANLVCPDAKTALDNAALTDARRIGATSDAAAVAAYPQIAKALGGPATLLYASPQRNAPDLRLLLSSPPVLVLGPRLASIRARSRSDAELDVDAELRFRLGRIVELARP
ncbi:MAG: tetratricopeptide repeat protein, partial [Kofleriaceae bacterium]|nr:tetratricopeptide repeat protein [Kofleriaceae bacterium]